MFGIKPHETRALIDAYAVISTQKAELIALGEARSRYKREAGKLGAALSEVIAERDAAIAENARLAAILSTAFVRGDKGRIVPYAKMEG